MMDCFSERASALQIAFAAIPEPKIDGSSGLSTQCIVHLPQKRKFWMRGIDGSHCVMGWIEWQKTKFIVRYGRWVQ
jgi:hypothetical protein